MPTRTKRVSNRREEVDDRSPNVLMKKVQPQNLAVLLDKPKAHWVVKTKAGVYSVPQTKFPLTIMHSSIVHLSLMILFKAVDGEIQVSVAENLKNAFKM